MFMMDEYRKSKQKDIEKNREGIDMLVDVQALKELADVDICTVAKELLMDIRDVKIDESKSRKERISDILGR